HGSYGAGESRGNGNRVRLERERWRPRLQREHRPLDDPRDERRRVEQDVDEVAFARHGCLTAIKRDGGAPPLELPGDDHGFRRIAVSEGDQAPRARLDPHLSTSDADAVRDSLEPRAAHGLVIRDDVEGTIAALALDGAGVAAVIRRAPHHPAPEPGQVAHARTRCAPDWMMPALCVPIVTVPVSAPAGIAPTMSSDGGQYTATTSPCRATGASPPSKLICSMSPRCHRLA